MNLNKLKTVQELEQFLVGTQPVAFCMEADPTATYQWIQKTLALFKYFKQGKRVKGIVTQYLVKITGYSRQQVLRLIQQSRNTGQIVLRYKTEHQFAKKYPPPISVYWQNWIVGTIHSVGLPLKSSVNAPTTVSDNWSINTRLAGISVAHLYNLRHSTPYTRQRWHYEKTKPKASTLGVRRKPTPNGQPGYIRIDTVHQGDFDKEKGVYHINSVDEVTQFEVICTVEKISEQYLIPVLEELLKAFPFVILNFHSDNGSEYVNQHVVALLRELFIEFTKSRARHSNDNALAESKNGAIMLVNEWLKVKVILA